MNTKRIFGGILVCVVVLVTVTACTPSPEKVLKKMVLAMSGVQSYNTDISIGVHGQFPQLENLNSTNAALVPGALIVKLSGPIDVRKDLAYDLAGDIKYRLDESELTFAGAIRYLANTMYFSLSEVPNLQIADLSKIKGNWYKFDFGSLGLGQDLSSKQKKIDEKKNKALRKLIQKTDFFDVVTNNGVQDLDGKKAYNFQTKLNEKDLKTFLQKATEIMEDRSLTSQEKTDLEKSVQSLSNVTGNLWIGEDDYMLYKAELSWLTETEERGSMKYDIALNFSDFDQDFEIKLPGNVRDFNMAEVFMPGLDLDLMGMEAGDGETLDFEEQLKQIEGVDPVELEKQLEELKKQLGDLEN